MWKIQDWRSKSPNGKSRGKGNEWLLFPFIKCQESIVNKVLWDEEEKSLVELYTLIHTYI